MYIFEASKVVGFYMTFSKILSVIYPLPSPFSALLSHLPLLPIILCMFYYCISSPLNSPAPSSACFAGLYWHSKINTHIYVLETRIHM